MIVNPYNEIISLHDVNIKEIKIKNNNAYIKLDQAYMISINVDYVLDDPLIIINDLLDIRTNKDYPIRIRLIDDDQVYTPTLEDFNKFKFEILEESYGFGLVHFYGIATIFEDDRFVSYDAYLDFHYCGDLEIKWDSKIFVETYYEF